MLRIPCSRARQKQALWIGNFLIFLKEAKFDRLFYFPCVHSIEGQIPISKKGLIKFIVTGRNAQRMNGLSRIVSLIWWILLYSWDQMKNETQMFWSKVCLKMKRIMKNGNCGILFDYKFRTEGPLGEDRDAESFATTSRFPVHGKYFIFSIIQPLLIFFSKKYRLQSTTFELWYHEK